MSIILYINSVSDDRFPSNGEYLLRAAKRMGLDSIRDIRETKSQPDYVLNCEYYEQFYVGKKWTAAWEVDLYLNREQWKTTNILWKECNEIFVAMSTLPSNLESFRDKTTFLPLAIDSIRNQYKPQIEKGYDFLISGSTYLPLYKKRLKDYELLKKHFSWEDKTEKQSFPDFWDCLHEARVQFVRSGSELADSIIPLRFFEGLVIGPLLTHRAPDLKKTNFIEDQDYLAYDNTKEMIGKMNLLLNNPIFSKGIADNGRKKVLRDHLFENRLEQILATIPNE